MMAKSELENLPIKYCEPHPDFRLRFEYDVDTLAESIFLNGQLSPGYAIQKPDGTGYLVFIGVRRLLACKKSFELHGKPTTYRAFVPERIEEKEMHILAMVENESEKGQRQDLSIAEEIAYYGSLRLHFKEEDILEIGTKAGKDKSAIRNMITLAKALNGVLQGICSIEKRADFRFKLSHYEELSRIQDHTLLFQIAAVAATARRAPAIVDGGAAPTLAKGVSWFSEVFPNVVIPDAPSDTTAGSNETKKGSGSGKRSKRTKGQAAVIMPKVYLVKCRHCRAQIPFTLKAKSQITSYVLGNDGRQQGSSSVPDALYLSEFVCGQCGKKFWVNIAEKEGRLLVDTFVARTVRVPSNTVEESSLMYDWKMKRPDGTEGGWMVVRGDRRYLYEGGRMELVG